MSSTNDEREVRRQAVLDEFGILDTPPDGAFDHITALAAQFFDVPISLISLVDEDRIWMKSSHGADIDEIDRAPGLCASVIFQDEAYVVEDALDDPRTLDNPLVAGEFGLRFYAAAPLVTANGFRLGTINVLDFEPRPVTSEEKEALQHFARLVINQMELRLSTRELVRTFIDRSDTDNGSAIDEPSFTVCAWTKRIRVDGQWLTFEEFLTRRLGATLSHGIHPDAVDQLAD